MWSGELWDWAVAGPVAVATWSYAGMRSVAGPGAVATWSYAGMSSVAGPVAVATWSYAGMRSMDWINCCCSLK